MAACAYCGMGSGFLKSKHADCFEAWTQRENVIPGLINELSKGRLPEVAVHGSPIILRGGERSVYAFSNIVRLETTKRREYAGASVGVSVRVARGVTIRPRESTGTSTTVSQTEASDVGALVLTTFALYFVGQTKSERVDLSRVIACFSENGIVNIDDGDKRYTFRPRLLIEAKDIESMVVALLRNPNLTTATNPTEEPVGTEPIALRRAVVQKIKTSYDSLSGPSNPSVSPSNNTANIAFSVFAFAGISLFLWARLG